jgi:ferredoxin
MRGARGATGLALRLLQQGRLAESRSVAAGAAAPSARDNLNAACESFFHSRVSEASCVSSSRAPLRSRAISVGNLGVIGEPGRFLGSSALARLSTSAAATPQADAEKISVTFVDKDGEETEIKVPVGTSMLEAAHENDIELEGACEGSLACSTCHVIIMDEEQYNKLPEPSDEENDMLDLAFGLTETSRLGCQVIAKPELDGLRLALPAATRNFAVDGHVPKPH